MWLEFEADSQFSCRISNIDPIIFVSMSFFILIICWSLRWIHNLNSMDLVLGLLILIPLYL